MDGYLAISRSWHRHDTLELEIQPQPRLVVGDHLNASKVAVLYGPLVLAADSTLLGVTNVDFKTVGVADKQLAGLEFAVELAQDPFRTWPGAQLFRINGFLRRPSGSYAAGARLPIRLVPFADAGCDGSEYKVWLPVGLVATPNVLFEAAESQSRKGNLYASMTDDDRSTVVNTCDGRAANEDWYAATPEEPVTITRVVFVPGAPSPDGGWFDASAGKPKIQAKTAPDAEWQTLGELQEYPATTATDPAGLKGGEALTFKLATPLKITSLRIIGKPASGDNPNQAYSTCAELEAFKDK
jgi:hypothetical protein